MSKWTLLLAIAGCTVGHEDAHTSIGADLAAQRGLDYAWSRPSSPQALKAAGYSFVARYLSYDTSGKNLTAGEARDLFGAGIDVVANWEWGASDALNGYQTGHDQAQKALDLANACGMPADRPIYFSVDFDATPAQQTPINDYMDGVASVIGRGRTGAYGGYYVIKRLFDAGKITFGWQTYAWSGGQWDARAQLRQVQNGITAAGDGDCCDLDNSYADDFGQWGHAPAWKAAFVSQSWPLATTAMTLKCGQAVKANIVLRNTGSKSWDTNTKLGTTQPRDRSSRFAAADWLAPNRLSHVSGTVAPNGTFQFAFTFQGPTGAACVPGMYHEYFGMVEEGVAWFSDAGQGGPPDNQLEALINLVPGDPPPDMAHAPGADMAGTDDGADMAGGDGSGGSDDMGTYGPDGGDGTGDGTGGGGDGTGGNGAGIPDGTPKHAGRSVGGDGTGELPIVLVLALLVVSTCRRSARTRSSAAAT